MLNGRIVRIGAVVLLTLVAYAPAMQAGFIWDDNLFLTENPLIKAKDGLYRFWFTTEPPDYFPLVSTSFWLEWRLWGKNPTGYHVVNIVFHAVSSILIWLVLRRLKVPGAWLAAVIFSVHPVNVETVGWITERKNTQPMLFYLVSILLYLSYERDGHKRLYIFSIIAFLLALLSKTSVVMLPFVLLGCAWWQRGLIERKDLIRVAPFFVLAAALGLVTVWFQYHVAIGDDIVRTDTFLGRLAGAGWAVWFYLYKAVIPHNLSFVYPRWEIDASSPISYLPTIAVVVCFLTFWRYRQNWGRAFLFGFGYFVVTLFPVLGFFDINFMRFSFVTDHWQYFSIPGVIALVVGLGVWLRDRWQRKLHWSFRAAAVAAVCLFGFLTWKHSHAFKNPEALWRDTISKNPEAWLAQANLGSTLAARGKYDEAITHCYEALRMNPTHPWIHCALGTTLVGQRRFGEAISHFKEALRLDADFAQAHQAHNDLGLSLGEIGRFEEARHHFLKAIEIRPDFAVAHANLGLGLAKRGRLDEGICHFRQAVAKNPDFAEAHYNLGVALALQGRENEAFEALSEAVRLNPRSAEGHLNLGSIYARQGQLEKAIKHFAEALRIRPDSAEARRRLRQAREDSGLGDIR